MRKRKPRGVRGHGIHLCIKFKRVEEPKNMFLHSSRQLKMKQDAAFSLETSSIILASQAALIASKWSARHAAARLVAQLRASASERKNWVSLNDCGRGPGPRTASSKDINDASAMIQMARTRDCGGSRFSWNDAACIAFLIDISLNTGCMYSGRRTKPAHKFWSASRGRSGYVQNRTFEKMPNKFWCESRTVARG
jgi:hypothetical protein